jgi:hypothetical protein
VGFLEDDEDDSGGVLTHGRRQRRVAFMPSYGTHLEPAAMLFSFVMCIHRYDSYNILPGTLAARMRFRISHHHIVPLTRCADHKDQALPGL